MIELHNTTLAGIEVLHACPAGAASQSLPTLVFYHGFTSSKLVYSYIAVAIAQYGIRCVMPDLPLHGARFTGDKVNQLGQFWPVLATGIDEFTVIKDAIARRGWCESTRLMVGGASLGGMTALGIMATHSELAAGISLMGSASYRQRIDDLFPPTSDWQDAPQMTTLLAKQLIDCPQALAGRPLLLWHGDADDVVPAADTRALAAQLQAYGEGEQLTVVIESGVGHRITPEALEALTRFLTTLPLTA